MKFSLSMLAAVAYLVLCSVSSPGQNYAGESKIHKKNVPAPVLKAFEEAYPKAKVTAYAKEVENGTTYYELETVEGKIRRDLLYMPDGTIAEIEESVSMKELPEAVARAFAKESPKRKPTKIEKVTKGEKVTYDFSMGEGRSELVIDPSGQVLQHSQAVTEGTDEHDANEGKEKEKN